VLLPLLLLLYLLQGWPQERLVLLEPLAGRLLMLLPNDPPAHIKKVQHSTGSSTTSITAAAQTCCKHIISAPAAHALACTA
jgi:hypothetical protein